MQLIDFGSSFRSGEDLFLLLDCHFRPGTYDLIRKSCNSFSDCALFVLVRQRLDRKYRALERAGAGQLGMVHPMCGQYRLNREAADFDLERTIRALAPGQNVRDQRGGHSRPSGFVAVFGTSCLEPLSSPTLISDEELARRLQAEEDGGGNPLCKDDELCARRLMAEEDERFARELGGEGTQARASPTSDTNGSRQTGDIFDTTPPWEAAGQAVMAVSGLVEQFMRRRVPRQEAESRPDSRPGDARGSGPALLSEVLTNLGAGVSRVSGELDRFVRSEFDADGPSGAIPRRQHPGRASNVLAYTAEVVHDGTRAADPGNDTCTVCFELFAGGDRLRVLPCLHRFHRACIDPWLSRSSECPVCKRDVTA